ncbi:MAG: META domain-containing protein [Planctomycetota bacterium]
MHVRPTARFVGVAACLFVLTGCLSPQAREGDWEQVVKQAWELTHLDGRRPITAGGETVEPLTLDLSDDGRAAGFAGVNRFFGTYESTPQGELRFAALGSTRMFRAEPPGLMDQEQTYLATLGEIDSYRLQGGKLVLISEGKKRLRFVPAVSETEADPATPG